MEHTIASVMSHSCRMQVTSFIYHNQAPYWRRQGEQSVDAHHENHGCVNVHGEEGGCKKVKAVVVLQVVQRHLFDEDIL